MFLIPGPDSGLITSPRAPVGPHPLHNCPTPNVLPVLAPSSPEAPFPSKATQW